MIDIVYAAMLVVVGLEAVFLLGYILFALDSVLRGHDLPTSRRAAKAVGQVIVKYRPGPANFCDLGCGRGTLALAIKKNFPHFGVVATDNSAWRIFLAKLKGRLLRRRISFLRMDIFEANVSKADIVYTYLWYDLMPPLEQKLLGELKKGALVITNTSRFPHWQPHETYITCSRKPDFEKLFVYLKN